jgi:hypothetical protein
MPVKDVLHRSNVLVKVLLQLQASRQQQAPQHRQQRLAVNGLATGTPAQAQSWDIQFVTHRQLLVHAGY